MPSTTYILLWFMAAITPFTVKARCNNRAYYDDYHDSEDDLGDGLLGSSIQLNDKELRVNDILMQIKLKEYDRGFNNPLELPPAQHFFTVKKRIDKSEVFKFIRKVPKGTVLHAHFAASLSLDKLIKLTYRENLYGCKKDDDFSWRFIYKNVSDECQWRKLSDFRQEDPKFDDFLRRKLSLVVDDPKDTFKTVDDVWQKFEPLFNMMNPLRQRDFFEDYTYAMLEEYYQDGVILNEVRYGTYRAIDSNGVFYTPADTVGILAQVVERFQKTHPDYIGLRLIVAVHRQSTLEKFHSRVTDFLQMRQKFPSLVVGFDVVGQEDRGQPLSRFREVFTSISKYTKFFFHAGETNWHGTTSDQNLEEAIRLNTSRIGHAFAITKHPKLLRMVKQRQIGLEMNPISNQVLKLVEDLRNHPGAVLMAGGYPLVVTCDDPAFWGARGISYDWYMVFMATAPRNGDLRILKQLALNSLEYSSLEGKDKLMAFRVFERHWEKFLDDVLRG